MRNHRSYSNLLCAKTVILIPTTCILLNVTQYKSMVFTLMCAQLLLKISTNITASHGAGGKSLRLLELNKWQDTIDCVRSPNLEGEEAPQESQMLVGYKEKNVPSWNAVAITSFKMPTPTLLLKMPKSGRKPTASSEVLLAQVTASWSLLAGCLLLLCSSRSQSLNSSTWWSGKEKTFPLTLSVSCLATDLKLILNT